MRLIRLALLSVALLLAAAPARAATVRDMVDRQVVLTAPPRRIVSLVPSVTETLYVLGADDLLVGVTTFCDYPPAARQKPKVGGIVNPSVEAIVGLRPDLVLATTEGNRDATVQQLEALGIPTYVVSPKSFAGVLESFTRIAALTGRAAAGRELVEDVRRRAVGIANAVRARSRPRVLYVVWADPLVAPGRSTLLADLIRMAGGDSISGGELADWPRLSLEEVVRRAPEVIVVGSENSRHVEDALRRWRAQKIVLPAFRTGRVHTVNGDLLHRPGPRVIDGLEALARALHPGVLTR